MPSPFAHVTAGYLLYRSRGTKIADAFGEFRGIQRMLLLAGISLLPDLDVIPGLLQGDIGRYHNNFTHSLVVGFLVAVIIAFLSSIKVKTSWRNWFVATSVIYGSHIVLDLFSGGRGLMLLWPFTNIRFIAPVKLFYGVQWSLGLFNIGHVWTILTEILFFLVILGMIKLFGVVKSARVASTQQNRSELP